MGIDQAIEGALTDAVHRIRERALRQAMAMTNRLQPAEAEYPSEYRAAYVHGHRHARMQLYDELERMIACEAMPPPTATAMPTQRDGEEGSFW